MTKTGTLAPILNQREYTKNEEIVLNYFFTNTDKNIYCARNNMSNQLWAFLVGQYSRSSLSMRDRFLKLFEDSKTALEKWIIKEEEHISLDDLASKIEVSKEVNINFFEEKASSFLEKWGVDYGHNSLKDADRIRFAIEWVSIVATKIIESPFPALWDFQEKSTRYLTFSKETIAEPEIVKNSKFYPEIKRLSEELMDIYDFWLTNIKEVLVKNNIINKEEFSSERAYENTLQAKVFDIVRYVLPSSTMTSLWASFSTRTLESHLSFMLSSPNDEIRLIWESMTSEAKKLSPGLLKRVWEHEYEIKRRENVESYVKEFIKNTWDSETWYFKGITDKDRVSVIFEWDLDSHVLASIMFEWARDSGLSYDEALEIVEEMDNIEKEHLMKLALEPRWKFDRMPRALQHSTFMVEYLVDFWAYRDIQRHRATSQLTQWATSIHGYDYPELMDLPGMETFKEKYDKVMEEMTLLWKEVAKTDSYVLEYVSALWHLVRTTFEMNPWQMAYVTEVRTTPQGHESYRNLLIETFKEFKKLSPMFSKYIRVWENLESSRKDQEEKTEQKRKNLWI